MEIANTGQSVRAGSTGAGRAERNDSVISSDFDTFIRMLTAQIRNQDPLNPMDSADFAVQLATFSTVEQQVRTNDLLTTLGQQIAAQSLGQLSGWIGMEARAVMPAAFDGTPLKMTLKGSGLADRLELVVRNAQGNEIQRLTVPTEGGEYLWTGQDEFGDPLPGGLYMITTEEVSGGATISEEPVELHGRIVEAASVDGKLKLTMEDGQQVDADAVLGLRKTPG